MSAELERFEETKAALLEAKTRLGNQSSVPTGLSEARGFVGPLATPAACLTNHAVEGDRTSKVKNREDLKNHATKVALANKLVAGLREQLLGKESVIMEIELRKEQANTQAEAANEDLRVIKSKFKEQSDTWNLQNL